jgi:ATP-dependent DNA helicase RecQ
MPDDMFKAVVQVLSAWEWRERPVAVVSVPSSSRPQLVRGFAERLAQVGRLAYLGELGYRAGPPGQQFNSAKRVQAVRGTLAMPKELGAAVGQCGGPVLLIDDRVDTGWTVTLAAALIRHAGAPAVLPLVLATVN